MVGKGYGKEYLLDYMLRMQYWEGLSLRTYTEAFIIRVVFSYDACVIYEGI